MPVILRGKKFHYRVMVNGVRHSGVCEGCIIPPDATSRQIAAIKKQAEDFESAKRDCLIREAKDLEETERDIRKNKTVIALVENYKYELTGGHPIRLDEAFELACRKPAKRISKSSFASLKKTYWRDFLEYMTHSYPEITDLAHVRKMHCEAYVKYLTDHGRFIKEVRYTASCKDNVREIAYNRRYAISAKTIKEITGVCRWVFSCLMEDAGLIGTPWGKVILPEVESTPRAIYTSAEIMKIAEGISGDQSRMRGVYAGKEQSFETWCKHAFFCRPLFLIGASGWPEVDICTMTWDEVDWQARAVVRSRHKTGADMVLFFTPDIEKLLRSQPQTGSYVFPEHADMYLKHTGSVSYRVIKFLEGLGVATTIRIPDRRAASIKDHHSLRHSYCTLADKAKMPVNIRMKLVGHKTVAMAEHYADHNDLETLREAAQRLPSLLPVTSISAAQETSRTQLAALIYSLPSETVEYLLSQVNTLHLA